MADRVSQAVIETATAGTADARASQAVLSAATAGVANARTSQATLDVLTGDVGNRAHLSQIVLSVLTPSPPKIASRSRGGGRSQAALITRAPITPAIPPIPLTPRFTLRYALSDFVMGFQSLLPRGKVWPRDPDSIQTQTIYALLPTHWRQATAAAGEIEDSFPSSAVTPLADWEAALGLPDPCAGPDPTIAQRQAHVAARITYRGGQSVPYFIGYAAALGYAITIAEHGVSTYGTAVYGDRYYDAPWAYVWTVTETGGGEEFATYGSARYGDPYASWGSTVLECELRRVAPAHTIVLFAYVGGV